MQIDRVYMDYPNRTRVPVAFHMAAAAFVAFCLLYATRRPEAYRDAMQEDRLVEWLSVIAYAAAGVIALRQAVRNRRPFDALVAAFLLFVAGEEMSWGQRLLGLTPPAYFLEHNTQQEMNLHNFSQVFGGPKGPFTLVLVGYAVVMPLAALSGRGRALLARIGATPPPPATIPWFVVAIALFVWYPVSFTGEWNELLAGATFLVAMGTSPVALAVLVPAGLVVGTALAFWSARGVSDPDRLACAAAELRALADALDPVTLGPGSAHRRVWAFVREERLSQERVASQLGTAACEGAEPADRRRFAVDPWGTAYWMRVRQRDDLLTVTVYSFGPNRRRDMDADGSNPRDDLHERRTLRLP